MPIENFMWDGYVTDDFSNLCPHGLDRLGELWRSGNRGKKFLLIPVVVRTIASTPDYNKT
jgi:hypothetical protein